MPMDPTGSTDPMLADADLEQLDNWFVYHRPTADQTARYQAIRDKARELALLVIQSTPRSPDRTAALRDLRKTVHAINMVIACNERDADHVK
jgi:hypothetical protein